MELIFLGKCFLVGISSACAIGPIFILIFNRAALCGLSAGFASAIGAAIGDGVFFTLGLVGALSLIAHVQQALMALNGLGGFFLIGYGIYTMNKTNDVSFDRRECRHNFVQGMLRAMTLTMINPLTLVFFIAMTMQILPECSEISFLQSLVAITTVFSGSLLVFSSMIIAAYKVGKSLKPRLISRLSWLVSILFIGAGSAMLFLFIQRVCGVKIIPYDSIF